ncbi:hypothetical protein CDAR_427921 [Caerostris darwini]|uniref:Uncharacterized protein n=1 Tax=Caerostris darwini TaxID=1538125 RepID=A0AAV4V9S5_9ARAC|nr:hypothetical protein CDAR_427921 [Caerostris darwini]
MNSDLCPRRLKTQEGFLQAVLKEMDGLQFSTCVQPLSPPVNPLETIITLYFSDLLSQVSKIQDCTIALFNAVRAIIYNNFPSDAWPYIYTNGSKLDINGAVGTRNFL